MQKLFLFLSLFTKPFATYIWNNKSLKNNKQVEVQICAIELQSKCVLHSRWCHSSSFTLTLVALEDGRDFSTGYFELCSAVVW